MTKLKAVKPERDEQAGAEAELEPSAKSRPLPPDPEVLERPIRRRFTAEFKGRIVKEAAACTQSGQVGALLRRHGLYHSHLVQWREAAKAGAAASLEQKKRGPQPQEKNPLAAEVARLEHELRKTLARAERAERLVALQKKVSEMLEIALQDPEQAGEAR